MRMRVIKKYFITGLLIWVPLVITVWVLGLLVATLEGFVPGFLSSESLFGVDIPGFRFVLVVAVVLLTGIFAANLIGRTMVDQWEALLGRIPLVRSIYNSVKQVSDTVLAPNGQAFRRAVLVQYPRAGAWTIAFVTGTPGGGWRNSCPASTSASTCRPRPTRPRAFSSWCRAPGDRPADERGRGPEVHRFHGRGRPGRGDACRRPARPPVPAPHADS